MVIFEIQLGDMVIYYGPNKYHYGLHGRVIKIERDKNGEPFYDIRYNDFGYGYAFEHQLELE